MLSNYIKLAFRNIIKNPFYSALNIIGLTIGIICVIFITLYINDELSYDKHNQKYKRIYRLESKFIIKGKDDFFSMTQHPLAPTLKSEYPAIEEAVRVRRAANILYTYQDKEFYAKNMFMVDSSYFKLFDHKWIEGDPETALSRKLTMVITKSFSTKYFGDESPIGKTIYNELGTGFEITGLIEDPPLNSHFRPEAMFSYHSLIRAFGSEEAFNSTAAINFWRVSTYTFLLMKEGLKIESVLDNFTPFYDKYMKSLEKQIGGTFELIATRLDNVHHNINKRPFQYDLPTSNFTYVYILFLIGIFILIIASINYMNLATARSVGRSKEVAIRKVSGSTKTMLISQFLSESFLITVIATILSVLLAFVLLPEFNNFAGKNLSFSILFKTELFIILISIILLLGFLSGSYSAFYLSKFNPAKILKGEIRNQVKSGKLRKFLVIVQFSLAVIMITGTFLVSNQLDYMRSKPLGFDKENMFITTIRDTSIRNNYNAFREKMLSNNNIIALATSTGGPGSIVNKVLFKVENPDGKGLTESPINFINCDFDYVNTMGYEIISGRNFNKELSTESQQSILVNETMLKEYGWGDDGIGRKVHLFSDGSSKAAPSVYTVVGVLKDFHYASLHNKIAPIMLFVTPTPMNNVSIRLKNKEIPETMDYIESVFKEFGMLKLFNYTFLDENLDVQYKAEENVSILFKIFSLIAIFIACLGLLGLSAYITEQKTKEIGIRKVMGASVTDIVIKMTKNFITLVFIGVIIAIPIAYLIINNWIKDFAYRMEIGIAPFIISGILAILIALITVSIQAIKAARTNPINSLKYE